MLTLHEYQRRAADFMHEVPKAILALDLGLGKTATTLTNIAELLCLGEIQPPVLVVAPQRVAKHVWPVEASKWAPELQVVALAGTPRQREELLDGGADVFTVGKELLGWAAERLQPEMVVFDDCPPRRGTDRFKIAKKLSAHAKRVAILTATPAPNSIEQLWPLALMCDGGDRLGRAFGAFQQAYFEPDKRSRERIFTWKPTPGSVSIITDKVSDIMVSMKSADYLTLPDRIDNEIRVSIPLGAYEQLERDLLLPFKDGVVTAATAAVLCQKLLQASNGAIYDEARGIHWLHDAKLDALEEIEGDILVFYSFQHDRERILKRFKHAEDLDVEKWNAGKQRMAIAHPTSAGHGLNLQAHGDGIAWFGLTYSLEAYLQANARLHRQGREKPVVVHHIVADQTIDDAVVQVLRGKQQLQDAILERTRYAR